MRTPAQTLERLAEVAPQEWGCAIEKGKFVSHDLPFGTYPEEGDVENSQLTAWCKKQLDEKGFSTYTIAHIPGCVSVEAVGDDGCIHSVSARPTEWQAVAECLIAVLEKEAMQ